MLYHHSDKGQNAIRTNALQKINDKYNYAGLEYPVSLEGVAHFENLNKVCIYVYEIDEDTGDIIDCKKGNTCYINNVIYLLRIEDDEKAHYIYIKHVGRLLNLHHYLNDKDTTDCPILQVFYQVERV